MDIIYKSEWEYLKSQPSIWNKYEKSIPYDDRDLGVFDVGYGVVLPKFFVQYNHSELAIDKIGAEILRRHNLAKEEAPKEPVKISYSVSFDPRPEQQIVFDTFIKEFQETGNINGILQARPGVGKTFMSIKLSSMLGYKTLCIVPNSILEDQWVDEIMNFTGLSREKIGVLQGSDISKIKKDKILDNDIIVVKIQTLLSQLKRIELNELSDFYSKIGLVFYDECHQSGAAESYAKTAIIFKTDNIIGLSATPFVKGINEFLMKNSIGDVKIDLDHQNLLPTVTVHNVPVNFSQNELNKLSFAKSDYIRFLATHNMLLEDKDEYLNHLADWVTYHQNCGHISAVLFATNKLVFKMEKILKSRGLDVGVITGSTSKKIEKAKEYITRDDLIIYYNNYYNIFPKRKSCKELKMFKDDQNKYYINAAFKKDLVKINKYLNGNDMTSIDILSTPVNELTEREIMGSKNVIVSNFKMLTTGYSRAELSHVIIGTPLIGSVPSIQVTGRITRALKTKNQDIQAQFFFTNVYVQSFKDMHFTLINNLKKSYKEAKFKFEGFNFEKTNKR